MARDGRSEDADGVGGAEEDEEAESSEVEALICGGLKLEWLNDLSRIDIGGGGGALPLNIGGPLTAFARRGLVAGP